ncbi:MAG TPA: beta-propeller domain-containing protein [Candidatus Thermoplasmatota archaeon]|nr:beta-propeller domain-containing protein [Candidatus Thermoplasmatota archaeon]
MEKKTTQITGILIVSLLVCASLVAVITLSPLDKGAYTYKLNTFESYDDLRSFLEKRFAAGGSQGRLYDSPNVMFSKESAGNDASALGGEAPPSYSTTNVQVVGVDEPDIVKTDGTYLYVVANQTVYIIRAYPVFEATILAQIRITNVSISNIFIRGDRLVVFGNTGGYYGYPLLERDMKVSAISQDMWWGGISQTAVNVYDLSERAAPVLVKEIRIDGGYFDARLIDEYVYLVATEYTYNILYAVDDTNYTLNVPQISIDNETQSISAEDIYYVDVPELSDTMTHVISLNLDTNDVVEKSFMLGSSQTMYVSRNNIFLASLHYPYYPLLYRTGAESSSADDQETTILHKISIDTGAVTYIAQGEVPGHILNQFSMDEHNGFFRIATTSGNNWMEGSQTSNNIYILDDTLQQISKIENIAPGESIYAARFLGDRAYLVTFVQVDPLFTIDLSDPYNPRILGELKIPGYSEYLHPYDETHIIGIGKEVDPSIGADLVHTPGAIYYTAILGLKIALFDVSDIEHPVEQAKIVIGDRGTDSPALYDHKAFLFDREKQLLVIPVSLYEITQDVKDRYIESQGTEDLWGEYTFQGAYVYRLSLEDGFEYQGRITHQTSEQMQYSEDYLWYWGTSSTDITRTMFIGDVLYTISDSMVKMNNLQDLSELSSISLS